MKELMKYSTEEYFDAIKGGMGGETPVGFLDARNEGWSKRIINDWQIKLQGVN